MRPVVGSALAMEHRPHANNPIHAGKRRIFPCRGGFLELLHLIGERGESRLSFLRAGNYENELVVRGGIRAIADCRGTRRSSHNRDHGNHTACRGTRSSGSTRTGTASRTRRSGLSAGVKHRQQSTGSNQPGNENSTHHPFSPRANVAGSLPKNKTPPGNLAGFCRMLLMLSGSRLPNCSSRQPLPRQLRLQPRQP